MKHWVFLRCFLVCPVFSGVFRCFLVFLMLRAVSQCFLVFSGVSGVFGVFNSEKMVFVANHIINTKKHQKHQKSRNWCFLVDFLHLCSGRPSSLFI